MKVTDIKVHPKNLEIYGVDRPDELEDLVKSIEQDGLFEPLVITKDNTLLSGHRRLQAIQQLGWEDVPVRVIEPDNEVIALVSFNKYRTKTSLVSNRETIAVAEQLRSQIGRGRNAPQKHGGSKGTVVDKTAEITGKSRQTVQRELSLERNAPDLWQRVCNDELSVAHAYKMMQSRWKPEKNDDAQLFATRLQKLLKDHQPNLKQINDLVRMTYPYSLESTGITQLQRDELLDQLRYLSDLDSRSSMLVRRQDVIEHRSLSQGEMNRLKSLLPTHDELEDWWSQLVRDRVTDDTDTLLDRLEVISTDDQVSGLDSKCWSNLRERISHTDVTTGPGRDMRFFVCTTINGERKLLGITQLHSDSQVLTVREEHIGWNEEQRANNREHIVNMMTCVATQPFGHNRLGVKFLCCLAPKMVEKWEQKYGQRIVAVMTTSLHGQESVYQGMKPRWRGIGTSAGAMLIKPLMDDWSFWNGWLNDHFSDTVDKTNGQSSPLQGKLKLLYKILGFNDSELTHSHKRGVFIMPLYDNYREFLCNEIKESQLHPINTEWHSWWIRKSRSRMKTLNDKNNVQSDVFFIESMDDVDYWLHLHGY